MPNVNNNNRPSKKVMHILNAYAYRSRKKSIFDDCWTKLFVSLAYYWINDVNEGDIEIDSRVFEVLSDYIFDVEEEFSLEDLSVILEEDYIQVMEYCCDMFSKDILSSSVAQYSQPRELTELICNLLEIKDGYSIYMPFSGYCSEVINLQHKIKWELDASCEVDGEELSPFAWAISMLRLEANCVYMKDSHMNANIDNADSFKKLSQKNRLYNSIIFTPPFGAKSDEGFDEYDAVRLAIENKLVDGGILCCLLPVGFLMAKGQSGKLREYLLKKGFLDTIITLPRFFSPYSNISTVLLVVKKNYNKTIRLVDGTSFITAGLKENGGGRLDVDALLNAIGDFSQDFCIIKSYKEIMHNNNLMMPALALASTAKLAQGEELYTLRNLAVITSKRSLTKEIPLDRSQIKTIRGLFDSPLNCEIQLDKTDIIDLKRDRKLYFTTVNTPCLVVQIKENSVKVGRISEQGQQIIQSRQNTFFFELNNAKVIPDFLLFQLQSDFVKKQIKAFLSGCIIGVLNENNFLDISVVISPLERQRDFLICEASKGVNTLNLELERAFEKYKRDIRTRKHALVQIVSSLSSHWNVVNRLRTKNNGIIDCNSTVGIINPVLVSDKFDAITNLLSKINKFIEHMADIDYSWGENVEIDANNFVENYIKNNPIDDCLMYQSCTGGNERFTFYAPVKAVEQVFNNIVANAKEHGFTDPLRHDYQIKFDVARENGNIIISISNNGVPLLNGVTEELVFTEGFSTKLNENGHQGTGGDEMKSIMAEFGDIEILSNPYDIYPVCYKLIFKNTIYNY